MKKTNIPTIHIALFVIVLVFGGIGYYFLQRQLSEANLAQAELDHLIDNREKLSLLSDSLPQLMTESNTWLRYLPVDQDGVAAFASTLEALAKERRLLITLDFDDFPKAVEVAGKNISGLGLTITIQGSFEGLRDFCSQMARQPYFFKTDKITVLKHETLPGIKATLTGSLMMNLTI